MSKSTAAIEILQTEREARAIRVRDLDIQLRDERIVLRSIDDALAMLLRGDMTAVSNTTYAINEKKPTLANQTQQILENAGCALRTTQILEKLAEIGRSTEPNSLLSTLSRLKQANIAEKVHGLWVAVKKPNFGEPLSRESFEYSEHGKSTGTVFDDEKDPGGTPGS